MHLQIAATVIVGHEFLQSLAQNDRVKAGVQLLKVQTQIFSAGLFAIQKRQ